MLKTDTAMFGELPPRVDEKGAVVDPGFPGIEITCTQLPCSAQREIFAWLLEQAPGAIPPEVMGGLRDKSQAGINFAYQWCRSILAAKGGIAYLQGKFGRTSVAMVERNGEKVREPLSEGLCDELFGARLSILLEWIVYNLVFNFADVLNLLPDWGKEIPSIVAAVMVDGATPATAKGEEKPEG